MSKEDKGGKCFEPEEAEDWDWDELDYAWFDAAIAEMEADDDEIASDEEVAKWFSRWANGGKSGGGKIMASKGKKRKKRPAETVDSRHQPTKAEMEEEIKIEASPEALARSLFPNDPPVVRSGKGEQSRLEFEAWRKRRANGG